MFGLNTARRVKAYRTGCGASLASVLLASSGLAYGSPALPSGGTVSTGSATISSPNGSSLQISQSSDKAIINWSQFSIGAGGAVQFNNGSGATLNRVIAGGPISSIDGVLSATGSVYLINPNGVIIGKSGQVNVGGTFVASTLDIPDDSFMAGGDLTFTGSSAATTINLGAIGAFGGDVVLIAQKVRNEGAINAPGGDVGLLAGTTVLLRDVATDDGKFSIQVGGPGTLASNTGSIAAAMVELRANGGNVYALAGDTTGVINATGVSTTDGKVFLVADGGQVTAHGAITAIAADGTGGSVETSGSAVDIADAQVTAANWLVQADSLDLTPAMAKAIGDSLANANVTLATTGASGSGDITLDGHIAWTSPNSLTLNAFGNIAVNRDMTLSGGTLTLSAPTGVATIDAPIKVEGAGSVDLQVSDFGFGLTEDGFAGRLSFLGRGAYTQALTINGQAYKLLYYLSDHTSQGPDFGTDDIAGISIANEYGANALATDLVGQGTAKKPEFTIPPIPSFSGTLEGLGHTITNFTITSDGSVGLIGINSGTVRDLGLVGGAVTNFYSEGSTGELAGVNQAHYDQYNSNYTPDFNSASIINTFATGSVSGAVAGGLVGLNTDAGGEVALISNSFSSGRVSGTVAGGLLGENQAEPYSTTSLPNGNAVAALTNVFATGAVQGQTVGGLVGESLSTGNLSITQITNAYATGAVIGTTAGGLIGSVESTQSGTSSVANTYATGAVTGSQAAGGLVGAISADGSVAAISTSYWDTTTTGQKSDGQNSGGADGAKGLTTQRLTHGGATFTGSSFAGGTDGIYPYLVSLPPNGHQ